MASQPSDRSRRSSSTTTYQAKSGLPRKLSVDAIVSQFETRERLSSEAPRPLSKAIIAPSPFIRSRFSLALNSRKPTLSEYSQQSLSSRNAIREDEVKQIESALQKRRSIGSFRSLDRSPNSPRVPSAPDIKSPRVRVLTTDHSIVIHILEGVKLPFIATIRSSGSFETHMPSAGTRADSAPDPGSISKEPAARPQSRAATGENQEIETVEETSEPSSSTPQKAPSINSVRRRVRSISGASVPPPQISEVVAQGELFIPDHTKESKHAGCANWSESAEGHPEVDNSHPQDEPSTQKQPDTNEAENQSGTGSTTELERLLPISPNQVPEILVHRPSGTESNMAVLGTDVIKNIGSAAVSPTTAVPALASTVSAPTEGIPALPAQVPGAEALPLTAPVDIPGVGGAPVNAHVPAIHLPVGGKLGKRKRVIGKARKVVLRKRVLSMLLGRKIAGTVHSLLTGTGGPGGALDVPVGVRVTPPGVPL